MSGCQEEYTDSLFVYPEPIPRFSVEKRSGCVPVKVSFNNESVAWTDMEYLWDFGDGDTSSAESPVHIYPKPGIYNVSLVTTTNEVCNASISALKIGYIRANEIPKARLLVSRPQASILDPVITFFDRSSEKTICRLDLGDGLKAPTCNFTHTYKEAGKYTGRTGRHRSG